MTAEQAQQMLDALPTLYDNGRNYAKKHIADGWTERLAKRTDLDRLFGKEWEQGFFDYWNAYKIINQV
jgi:hypothetical protein